MAMNPFTQTDTQQGVADYAMPYVQNMLGATQSQLFNYDPSGQITGLRGYTPYSMNAADYFAGFTPLQQQAQQGVAGLSLPSTFGQSIGLTGEAYGNLMGTAGQAGQAGANYAQMATNPYAIGAYMNPYLMQSLAPQMELLRQQQGIQANQLAGQATQAGAFGGSRYGIQRGLQDQANQLAMSNLVGQGYNQAYNDAIRNMQYGAGLGLQGQQAAAGMYGQGLSAANQLANIGNQALGAQQNIYNLQNQFGGQQQQLGQNVLNQAVQNYNTAYQYPQQQLSFMKNMLSGLPFGTTSVQNYQQAPTMAQNIAAAGMGLYGLGQLLGPGGATNALNTAGSSITDLFNKYISPNQIAGTKAGGLMKSYARGGIAYGDVTSQENKEDILNNMHPDGLPRAYQGALMRGDMPTAAAAQSDMAEDASIRQGLGYAFNQLPQQARTQMLAGGGIIAFKEGGKNDSSTDTSTDDEWERNDDGLYVAKSDSEIPSEGNAIAYAQLAPLIVRGAQRLQDMPEFVPQTAAQRAAAEKEYVTDMETAGGVSPYGGLRDYLTQAEADRGTALQQGQGLAFLAGMKGMLKPGGFARGLGEAGDAFATHYGQALAADRAEKRSIAQMNFNLADAERKERMGLRREAQASVQNAEANRLGAYKARILKEQAAANALARTAQAMKPTAQKTPSQPKLFEQLAAAEIAYEKDPNEQNLQTVTALRRAADRARYSVSDIGGVRADIENTKRDLEQQRIDARVHDDANDAWDKMSRREKREWGSRSAFVDDYKTKQRRSPATSTPKPTPKPAPIKVPLTMPSSQKDLKTGELYDTSRGPAIWNGKNFVSQE